MKPSWISNAGSPEKMSLWWMTRHDGINLYNACTGFTMVNRLLFREKNYWNSQNHAWLEYIGNVNSLYTTNDAEYILWEKWLATLCGEIISKADSQIGTNYFKEKSPAEWFEAINDTEYSQAESSFISDLTPYVIAHYAAKLVPEADVIFQSLGSAFSAHIWNKPALRYMIWLAFYAPGNFSDANKSDVVKPHEIVLPDRVILPVFSASSPFKCYAPNAHEIDATYSWGMNDPIPAVSNERLGLGQNRFAVSVQTAPPTVSGYAIAALVASLVAAGSAIVYTSRRRKSR
jgi:hypothetical protein